MKTIVVWFSCGAASAVAVKKTIEKYGQTHIVRVVNNPIEEEHEDNKRFLHDVEKWLGIKVEFAINTKENTTSCIKIWDRRSFMSGIKGAPCTMLLKKRARQEFQSKNHIDYHVLGFTLDEKKRHEKFILTELDNVLPVLIEENITKEMCFDIIRENKIKLPVIYDLGFPNANCIGCVKATSPTYWNLVRKFFPVVFNQRTEQSRRLGARLVRVKGARKFLDELKKTDKGAKIKSWECGIFCEEK